MLPEKRQSDATISLQASHEFQEFFCRWLDQNQEGLEIGGTGNWRELATLCAAWARANLLHANSVPEVIAYTIPDGVELRPHSIARVIGTSTDVRFEALSLSQALAASRDHGNTNET